ncbi:MAG: hypothetical protein EBX38_07035, partial [Actinobacteria bacterium]|nr:hypothetical protein [Actinomycetota bacterium]
MFIASSTTTASPIATVLPTSTSTFTIVPCIGAVTVPPPPDVFAAAARGARQRRTRQVAAALSLPSPGTISALKIPDGFGVRFDGGYEAGDTVSQYYDNLIGKLIVWGKDRPTAIARTIRALDEMKVEGVHTTIPADLAILRHPDFAAVQHSTKWVEERLDLSDVASTVTPTEPPSAGLVQKSTTVEVNGKRFEVKVWVPESGGVAPAARRAPRAAAANTS